MRVKEVENMWKWNRLELNEKQILFGVQRLKKFCAKYEHYVYAGSSDNGLWNSRLIFWVDGRSGVISRIARTKVEAQAKVGLCLPVKAWGIEL